MPCDPDVKQHLNHAKEQIQHALDVAGERLISDDVRGHLRNSARHLLHAGLAALDADQQRRSERTAQRAAQRNAPAHPPAPPEPPKAT